MCIIWLEKIIHSIIQKSIKDIFKLYYNKLIDKSLKVRRDAFGHIYSFVIYIIKLLIINREDLIESLISYVMGCISALYSVNAVFIFFLGVVSCHVYEDWWIIITLTGTITFN